MGLLSREFTLRTSLTPEQVKDALNAQVKPGGLFTLDLPRSGDPIAFRGRVRPNQFDIVGRNQFRNSFVPLIHGDVSAIDGGSEIAVKLSMHLYMLTFIVVWFLVSLVGLGVIVRSVLDSEEPLGPVWLLTALPFGGLAAAWVGFRLGIEPAKTFLRETLPIWVPRPSQP